MAILTEPTVPEADFGLFFGYGPGYLEMCGMGVIAVAVAIQRFGLIGPEVTRIIFDTASGLVPCELTDSGAVAFQNVPCFVEELGISIAVPEISRTLHVDIAFGGHFYALVDVSQLGVSLALDRLPHLMSLGEAILRAVRSVRHPVHPERPDIHGITLLRFYDHSALADGISRNISLWNSDFDRSPCGTGTSAELALLARLGLVGLNQEVRFESIIGTHFIGKNLVEAEVAGREAQRPQVKGQAHVIGIGDVVLEEADPLSEGFLPRAAHALDPIVDRIATASPTGLNSETTRLQEVLSK
jgi:proline racemase